MGGEWKQTPADTKETASLLTENQEQYSLAVSRTTADEEHDLDDVMMHAPIISSYNDRIRPLLDVVDRLRNLNVMKEGIQLPTIVVVGDQSSGKSSVLESLAGISLPRGEGICTRVPLVMRLQNLLTMEPEIWLEFEDKVVRTDEKHIIEAIGVATDEIAGTGKGISKTPLTLVVRKNGVPDLTMVDLPGITRVPVHGQPENIYELIADMIMEYIKPEETIILNVLSATVDFSTCESIRMSRKVDKTGERTLAVVTKVDIAPEGLREKVMADDVNIGLGYVCVRNRIGDETYEEARKQEALLFGTHNLLSKIDKEIVGVPVLAQKLMQIQATIIARCLPDTVSKITEKLNATVSELKNMPKTVSSVGEAMMVFMQIIGSAKESLRKLLIQGEFDEFSDDCHMQGPTKLAEMFNRFSDELQMFSQEKAPIVNFLMDEIKVLEELKGIGLPNFLPRSAFLAVFRGKINDISQKPVNFMCEVWQYVEDTFVSVLNKSSENYPQLQSSMRRAAHNFISKKNDRSIDRLTEMVEMEKLTDYTCNPEYMSEWTKLVELKNEFVKTVLDYDIQCTVRGFGQIEVSHLRAYPDVLHEAFDLKMRITAYWKIVLRRIVDNVALHIQFSVKNLVIKEMETEIAREIIEAKCDGFQKMFEESPGVASKRERLKNSVKLLTESKDVVASIIDRIALYGD